jgi:hypothetical protein
MKAGLQIFIKDYQCKLAATKARKKNHFANLPENGHASLAGSYR